MAYGRYDNRGDSRMSERGEDRFGRERDYPRDNSRDYAQDRSRDYSGDQGQRGFFERAGDEIASWFGDDDAERRRDRDMRERGDNRGWGDSRSDRYASRSERDDRFDRGARWQSEGYRRPYTGRSMRSDEGGSYRPMTGDYGRFDPRDRDERRDMFTGMASTAPHADRHYGEWRQRQIDALDRDYDDYRREHQSKFDNDFSSWRSTRESKRQMLGQVREHMDVVGSDDEHVGTVDKVRGDRLILTKSDSGDGQHHAVPCSMIDRVEGDKVILDDTAAKARDRLTSENRNRALFERDEDRDTGPHMLNRSFSGTY